MDRIACIGDNCIDYYDETREAYFGGNPVNVAVCLRSLGVNSSYLGAVGTDDLGYELKEAVARRGVDVSHVRILPGTTALTHVTIRDGDRVFGDYDEGVMAGYSLSGEDLEFIGEHRMAVTGMWGRCENDLRRIQAMGIPTVFDCSDRPDDPAARRAIPYADIVFFSDDYDGDEELKKKMQEIFDYGRLHGEEDEGHNGEAPFASEDGQKRTGSPKVVAVTRGERGSAAYNGKEFVFFGIIPCVIRDTMGAGDSYIAGFLSSWIKGEPLQACMESGARSSALTLGVSGAWPEGHA